MKFAKWRHSATIFSNPAILRFLQKFIHDAQIYMEMIPWIEPMDFYRFCYDSSRKCFKNMFAKTTVWHTWNSLCYNRRVWKDMSNLTRASDHLSLADLDLKKRIPGVPALSTSVSRMITPPPIVKPRPIHGFDCWIVPELHVNTSNPCP